MPIKNFTATSIKAESSSGRQVDYWDTNLVGFGVRVAPSGRKTWTVMYRHLGRLRRLCFGTYPPLPLGDARDKARDLLHEAAKGLDPATKKREDRSAATFRELARIYIDEHAKRNKRSWREDERVLYGSPQKKRTGKRPHVPLVTSWGSRKVKEITRADVRELIEAVGQRGAPVMANRVLALVHKMFNLAIERDWIEANPCARVKRYAAETPRDRVLSDDEIVAIWNALDAEHELIRAFFRLRLLTAQRGGELLGARWDEIDLETGWWTLPKDRTKNALAHRVPLSPMALEILDGLRQRNEKRKSAFVFQTPKDARHDKPIKHAQKAIERVRSRAGIEFRGHDLRRTAASLIVGSGTPRLVVSKILNHVERGITAVYDRHSYDAEKRVALDAWSRRISVMLDRANAGKVLSFQR